MRYFYPVLMVFYMGIAVVLFFMLDTEGIREEWGGLALNQPIDAYTARMIRLQYYVVFWLCCGSCASIAAAIRTWFCKQKLFVLGFGLLALGWAVLALPYLFPDPNFDIINQLDRIIVALLATLSCLGAFAGWYFDKKPPEKATLDDQLLDAPF